MATQRPGFEHRPPRHGLIGPFGARQIAGGLVVVVAAVVLLLAVSAPLGTTGVTGPRDPRPTPYVLSSAPAEGLRPGQRAPELTVTRPDGSTFALTDVQGHPVSLAALRGKAVWINFFASWCPPCQAETPVLRDTYAAYRDKGVVIVGISVQETTASDVSAYATKYGLDYTIAADLSGDIFRLYGAYVLPTQVFIGPDGIVHALHLGLMTDASAAAELDAMLPSPGPTPSPSASPSPAGPS
ncbi:MAG TPA: TlpA disulfide reductase family protein [Candidatus Limnocylindrales bacterium]